MATFTISSVTATGEPNTPAYNLLANDTLNVTATGKLISSTFAGIQAAGSNTINVAGDVISGPFYAIYGAAGSYNITVATSGMVFGALGIFTVAGNNTLANHGLVVGTIGVLLNGTGNNSVTNDGSIIGTAAIGLQMMGANNTVNNSGLMEGGGMAGIGAFIEATLFTNSGTVRGAQAGIVAQGTGFTLNNSHDILATGPGGYGFIGTPGIDIVNNTGTISSAGVAAINFATGNDIYNGAGGKAVGAVLGGDDNDKLTGGVFVDILRGDAGNDTLTGGGANDTLDGGDGNDLYMLNADPAGDTLADTSGIDTVFSTISRDISPWVFIENLTLQGAGNIGGAGNAGNNAITGNGGNNTLLGGGGLDTLNGGAGIDTLNGGLDADVLRGGVGADILIGGGGADNLYGDGDNDIFRFSNVTESPAGAGRDTIRDLDDAGLGDDVIDLSLMAGVTTFIGAAAFTAAGQVRAVQAGANVLVQINTAGVSVAESEILIANATLGNGVGQVGANDFLL